MRYLITGGAGFIGSHLSRRAAAARPRGLRRRRPLDRQHQQYPPPEDARSLPLHDRQLRQPPAHGRAGRRVRQDLSPRRRRRRQADRRVAGPHHRDQHPPHRDHAQPRQQEEAADLRRFDERGLRQERAVPVQRGRRHCHGRHHQGPLVVRLQQGHRRVPRHRLLEGEEAADGGRAPLQHRRPAPDRAVRHGGPQLRAPGARRRARSPSSATASSRAASPTSATWCARSSASWTTSPPTATSSTSATTSRSPSATSPSRSARCASSKSEIVYIPYEKAYEQGFEDMPRRVPDLAKIRERHRLAADHRRCAQILTDVIEYQRRVA